jgi:hypothetical protein
MKKLLILTAALELGAAVALLIVPSAAVELLLGAPLDAYAAIALGRVAGVALFALSVANWLAHRDEQSCAARGVIAAMTFYNLGVAVVLGVAGVQLRTVGIALWPAVVLHAALTVWCIACLRNKPTNVGDGK